MDDTGFCSGCGMARLSGATFCPTCGRAYEAGGSIGGRVLGITTAVAGTGPTGAGARPNKRPRSRARTVLNVVVVALLGLGVVAALSRPGGGAAQASGALVAVTYQLTGSATSASITYTDGAGNIQQQSSVAVPLARKSGSTGISFETAHGDFVSFSAQNNGDSGDLTCAIEADGVAINRGHASGGYSIVSCSTQVP